MELDLDDFDDVMLLGAFVITAQAYYYWRILRKRRQKEARERRWWVRPINMERRQHGFHANLFRTLKESDHEEFYKYTRMTPRQFDGVMSLIRRHVDSDTRRGHRAPLPLELKLALTLQYLAHGDSRRSKSWEYRVGRSTVSKVIKQVCRGLVLGLTDTCLPAPEQETWATIADEYFHRWQFPNCVGAVDGKHIRVKAPPHSGSQYFNYKNFFSIVLLAVSDAKYRFVHVDIGQYGSLSDRSIWSQCELGKSLNDGTLNLPPPRALPGTQIEVNHVMIGDNAFALAPHLLRPSYVKNGTLALKEKVFNYRLSRARNTIENAFGILASRWRILHTPICGLPENICDIVMATILLHNYIMKHEEYVPASRRKYFPPHLVDRDGIDGNILPGEWRGERQNTSVWQDITKMGSNNYDTAVKAQRDVFANYFMSDHGNAQVPWQYRRALRSQMPEAPQ